MPKNKQYIKVEAEFDYNGNMRPIAIIWTDHIKYSIDRITDVRRIAGNESGNGIIRYTCILSGLVRYLFFEEGKWFTERKY